MLDLPKAHLSCPPLVASPVPEDVLPAAVPTVDIAPALEAAEPLPEVTPVPEPATAEELHKAPEEIVAEAQTASEPAAPEPVLEAVSEPLNEPLEPIPETSNGYKSEAPAEHTNGSAKAHVEPAPEAGTNGHAHAAEESTAVEPTHTETKVDEAPAPTHDA